MILYNGYEYFCGFSFLELCVSVSCLCARFVLLVNIVLLGFLLFLLFACVCYTDNQVKCLLCRWIIYIFLPCKFFDVDEQWCLTWFDLHGFSAFALYMLQIASISFDLWAAIGALGGWDFIFWFKFPEMKCYQHSDCPSQQACFEGKCKNPCDTINPCSPPEDCQVQGHEPVCVKGMDINLPPLKIQ